MEDFQELIRDSSTEISPIPTSLSPKLKNPGHIRCLAVDIYGTLLISRRKSTHQAFTILQETFNLPPLKQSLEQLIAIEHRKAHAQGIRYPEVEIRDLWRTLYPDHDPEQLALHFELLSHKVWPMPGLQIPTHLPLAIVSNAQFYTPLILDALCPFPASPDLTFYSFRHRRAKPGLDLFVKLKEALSARGIAASEALYLGNDHLKDIIPAQQTGFKTALFAGDQGSLVHYPDLSPPDAIITHLSQLSSLFEVSSLNS